MSETERLPHRQWVVEERDQKGRPIQYQACFTALGPLRLYLEEHPDAVRAKSSRKKRGAKEEHRACLFRRTIRIMGSNGRLTEPLLKRICEKMRTVDGVRSVEYRITFHVPQIFVTLASHDYLEEALPVIQWALRDIDRDPCE